MRRRTITLGFLSFATAVSLAAASPVALASGTDSVTNGGSPAVAASATGSQAVDAASKPYPSALSTIVGSVGFIDAEQVGYFWSVARGDSVTETFSGPGKVKKIILALDIPTNGLNSGAFVNWAVSINGTDVGSFSVVQGQLGPVTHTFTFPKKTGGTYTVKMRATNEVAGGQGAHTFRYAGTGQHSVTLKKKG